MSSLDKLFIKRLVTITGDEYTDIVIEGWNPEEEIPDKMVKATLHDQTIVYLCPRYFNSVEIKKDGLKLISS
jgi:hypothetical protein